VHRIAVRGEAAPGPTSAWLVREYSTHMIPAPRDSRRYLIRALACLPIIWIDGVPVALGAFGSAKTYRSFYKRHYVPLMRRAITVNEELAEPPFG
jgi:hypothetical protein